jgi:hypothetical protein
VAEVLVPLDVVASVIEYLRGKGLDARSQVPENRSPGMIRVSRVGGVPVRDRVRDQPRLLVECWERSQAQSFDLAQLVYAYLELAELAQALADIGATRVEPSPPVDYGDPYAPEMWRHQLTVEMTTLMGRMEVI